MGRMINQKGFTLIEILMVLIIIGILAGTAIPKFFDMQKNAEMKTLCIARNDMLSRAVVVYAHKIIENDGIPQTISSFSDLGLSSIDDVNKAYRDFVGTWNYDNNNQITYYGKNFVAGIFTLNPGQPPTITLNMID